MLLTNVRAYSLIYQDGKKQLYESHRDNGMPYFTGLTDEGEGIFSTKALIRNWVFLSRKKKKKALKCGHLYYIASRRENQCDTNEASII